MSQQKKPTAKVVDLAARKHSRLTLDIFDRMRHEDKRAQQEQRAEVERKARNRN